MKKILDHFKKVDPILYLAINRIGNIPIIKPRDPEEYLAALCREIILQQLSDKAGDAIYQRFLSLFPKGKVTLKYVLKLKDEQIRGVGPSWSKVSSIKDLALKVLKKELIFDNLHKLEDEKVIVELTKVKGIGRWTSEMFLMFSLAREDIFSHGDAGLKRALEELYKLENPTKQQIEEIVMKWSPYKTYACLILWRTLDS